MDVTFVNNNYLFGGAETVVNQLHSGCRRAGIGSRVFIAEGKAYPSRAAGIVPMYPRLLSWLHHSRLHRWTEHFFPRATWTDRAFRKIAESSTDVIHVHNFHGTYASLSSLASVATRKPIVWTFHRFWGITGGCDHPGECDRYLDACGSCPRVNEWPISGRDNTKEQLTLKRQHLSSAKLHIVSPSQHLKKMVQQSPVGSRWEISHIPNGVNPVRFGFGRKRQADFRMTLGLDSTATIVLVVNRDFRDSLKGFEIIKDALSSRAWEKGYRMQVLLMGRNSEWACTTLPEDIRPVDLGYVADRGRLAELYEAADIFLFASPRENFPCVVLEAMSSKCCVVSTPTDGVLEQIEDGVSGLLADSFQPECLAKALENALASPDLRRRCGDAARQRVEKEFTEDQMVQRHLSLYQELAQR